MISGPQVRETRAGRQLLLVLVGSVLFFLMGIGSLPLTDRDETRFSEATREMVENRDWIIPRLNGAERFDKPPLFYWLQAAGWAVLGISDTTARLPSVVCAALTVTASAAWARRIAGPGAGWFAAAILLTAPQMQVHARLAVADMPMVLAFTMASWSGWELARDPARRGWTVFFFGTLALGFLAKGPVSWLAVVPTYLLARRTARGSGGPDAVSRLHRNWGAGGLLTVGFIAIWGIPALWLTEGRYFSVGIGKHVVGRSIGVLEGHGLLSVWGYLAALPLYPLALVPGFLPWSIPLVRHAIRDRPWTRRDPETVALLGGAALVFLVFTLVRTKLPHYTLPAFPLLAVWLATRFARGNVPCRSVFRTAAVMVGIYGVVFLALAPMVARRMPVHRLAEAARPWMAPNTVLAAVEFEEPSLVWHFRAMTRSFLLRIEPAAAAGFLREPGPRACILQEGPLAVELRALPGLQEVAADGINTVNGRPLRLVAFIRPPVPGGPGQPGRRP